MRVTVNHVVPACLAVCCPLSPPCRRWTHSLRTLAHNTKQATIVTNELTDVFCRSVVRWLVAVLPPGRTLLTCWVLLMMVIYKGGE